QLLVNPHVVLSHTSISEPQFEFVAAASTTDLINFRHRFRRAIDILDNKTCFSFNYNFGDRTAQKTDHWRAAGKRFNHYQAERLRPVNWKEQSGGAAEQFVFFRMTNFADELDEGFVQQMLDVFVKVVAVDTIDLGRDLELATDSPGDLNRAVHSFFWRNPSEKEQIVLRLFLEAERVGRYPMVNRSHPFCLRQWAPLGMRNRDNGHIRELVIKRRQIGQVEPAVQGGHGRKRRSTRHREVKVVDMEMNNVELVETLKDLLQHDDMMGKRVYCLARSQRSLT